MWFKCVGTDPEVVEEKQQQPFITTESGLVGTVTTSSNWSSDYVGWKAFIDDQNSEWCSNDTTSWFQYQFNSPVNIHKITYKNKDAQRFHPIDQVKCSDDGTNWTDLDITSIAGQCDITNKTVYASYWKIIFTDHSYQSSQYPALGSLALIGYEKMVLPDPIILKKSLRQNFISHESELECTVSASSTFGGTWPAWKAFTNTSQDCWIAGATDSWWMVEFDNALNIEEIRYANLDANRFKPITAVYISDDGTNFTEVTPKTSVAGDVVLPENTFAKYWKFTFEGYSESSQYPLLAHLELWGYDQVVPQEQEKIAEWDFTSESLVDSVNGYVLENHNGILSSSGLSFETNSAYIDIPLDLLGIGRTYEIEFGEMDCEYSSNNNRVFGYRYYSNDSQSYSNQGLYYRGAASLWCVYDDTNGVQASNISDPNFFSNSIMKIEIGTDGKWKIYKNGELVFAPPSALPITPRIFNLGSAQYPFYNMVIKKFRIID